MTKKVSEPKRHAELSESADISKFIGKQLRSMEQETKRSFRDRVKNISKIYLDYSPPCVATALFVSSMWLPNISAQIKHQLLVAIFASLKPKDFTASKKITTYREFKNFVKRVYSLLPSFPFLEDYFPETDWGEVKFHYRDRNFKMFYGNDLSNVYDYLTLFQMLYLPFDMEYFGYTNRFASEELENCLQLQDDIISGVSDQLSSDSIVDLEPGHIEIPTKNFWKSCVTFYQNYNPGHYFGEAYLEEYSIPLGKWPKKYLTWEAFNGLSSAGKNIPSYFISCEGKYFPILPRCYSSILFDKWTEIFENYHDKVIHGRMPYSMYIGRELHQYIKERIQSSFLHPVVSAVNEQGLPHDTIFSTAFISKDRLVLLYVINPSFLAEKIQEDIERLIPKFDEAIQLINNRPLRLALNLKSEIIEIRNQTDNVTLEPALFILIPQVSTSFAPISLPVTIPGKVVYMDQFLGIMDELDNEEMLASFLEYLEEYGESISSFLIGPLDIFGSFKESYGVLIPGAREYSYVSLNPHWGSNLRYQTLSEFWTKFPDINFLNHPRSWKATIETESRTRLEAKGFFGCALYCEIGQTHIVTTSPFDLMSYEQGLLANQLMECIEDTISRYKNVVLNHRWFQSPNKLHILFFPSSLVMGNNNFSHLQHLNPTSNVWQCDHGFLQKGVYGIRLVFSDEKLLEAFTSSQDCSLEINLLVEILSQLNKCKSDSKMADIVKDLNKHITDKPRFKIFQIAKQASFPEFIDSCEPELIHFKRAKKKIAELAMSSDLSEGHYELEDAKIKINVLRDSVVTEINSEVEKYSFNEVIPYLLTNIDALTDKYERATAAIERSFEHEVDYSRQESYANESSNHARMHRNYRYLIEKFVQLVPKGKMNFDKEKFQYLIALIDWLHVFYGASDSLHYGLHALGMTVDQDYLVDVKYEEDIGAQDEEFLKEDAEARLGLSGNPHDRVTSSRIIQDFIDALDAAFTADLGFSFRSMINTLQIMARWGEIKSDVGVRPYYQASYDEIEELCLEEIEGIRKEEIKPILEFLTLRSSEVIKLTGQEEACNDLPVWEHRKRFARYYLRPLILILDKYFWGPYSTRNAGIIWSGHPSNGTLPADLGTNTIEIELSLEKKFIEDALVDKAYEIINRFTGHSKKNFKLTKLKALSNVPSDLGDYDVLAYHHDKNIVLNVECKDILQAFCLKDLKRLREKIFGSDESDGGHFGQINKRANYLDGHLPEIARGLKWPINCDDLPKIITIYLTRKNYLWTRFPPYDTDAVFLQIEVLSNYIESLDHK